MYRKLYLEIEVIGGQCFEHLIIKTEMHNMEELTVLIFLLQLVKQRQATPNTKLLSSLLSLLFVMLKWQ